MNSENDSTREKKIEWQEGMTREGKVEWYLRGEKANEKVRQRERVGLNEKGWVCEREKVWRDRLPVSQQSTAEQPWRKT